MTAEQAARAHDEHRNILKVLTGLLLAMFVGNLSGTIVGNALPVIVGEIGGTQQQYTWIITSTILASTAVTPDRRQAGRPLRQEEAAARVDGRLHRRLDPGRACPRPPACSSPSACSRAWGWAPTWCSPRSSSRRSSRRGSAAGTTATWAPSSRWPRSPGRSPAASSWTPRGSAGAGASGRPCRSCSRPSGSSSRTSTCPGKGRPYAKVDYLGAVLISLAATLLLVWVSFANHSFAWASWQTAVAARRDGRRRGRVRARRASGERAGHPARHPHRAHDDAGDRRQPRGRHRDVRRERLPRPVLPDRARVLPDRRRLARPAAHDRPAGLVDRGRALGDARAGGGSRTSSAASGSWRSGWR